MVALCCVFRLDAVMWFCAQGEWCCGGGGSGWAVWDYMAVWMFYDMGCMAQIWVVLIFMIHEQLIILKSNSVVLLVTGWSRFSGRSKSQDRLLVIASCPSMQPLCHCLLGIYFIEWEPFSCLSTLFWFVCVPDHVLIDLFSQVISYIWFTLFYGKCKHTSAEPL